MSKNAFGLQDLNLPWRGWIVGGLQPRESWKSLLSSMIHRRLSTDLFACQARLGMPAD